jgi:Uma2 family endonuclease
MSTLDARIAVLADIYGQAPPLRRMSEREFDAWLGEKTRAEWVDGEVIMMAPVTVDHDDVVGWLISLMRIYARRQRLGTIHGPEVLVRLPKIRRKRLPDVMFVSAERRDVVEDKEIGGPPDLIIEVVSHDSINRDWIDKYADYERAGVREYWVIDRLADRVECFKLRAGGTYRATKPREGRLTSAVLRGFHLRPEWVLGLTLPDELDVLKELGVTRR